MGHVLRGRVYKDLTKLYAVMVGPTHPTSRDLWAKRKCCLYEVIHFPERGTLRLPAQAQSIRFTYKCRSLFHNNKQDAVELTYHLRLLASLRNGNAKDHRSSNYEPNTENSSNSKRYGHQDTGESAWSLVPKFQRVSPPQDSSASLPGSSRLLQLDCAGLDTEDHLCIFLREKQGISVWLCREQRMSCRFTEAKDVLGCVCSPLWSQRWLRCGFWNLKPPDILHPTPKGEP